MSNFLQSLEYAIPLTLVLISLALPFNCGFYGIRFRTALLTGWGLFFLAFLVLDINTPLFTLQAEPVLMRRIWAALVIGWAPACILFLLGKLARSVLRLRSKSVSWRVFTAGVALFLGVIWWPGVRAYDFG